MNKTQIDEMVSVIIDRIDVTPMSNTEMCLKIKLKTGRKSSMTYVRKGGRYGCRSGNIFLIVSPERQWNFSRQDMCRIGHRFNIVYKIAIGI